MTEQIVFWLLTGLFIILVALLGILFKQNLNANSRQAEAVTKLSENVAVLSESMQNFKQHCERMEDSNLRRLNAHAKDITTLNETTIRHDGLLDEHGRRIHKLEEKK